MATFEEKLRKGDKKAFEQLVRENQNKIYAVCLNMLKNTHDAQDAAQETFIKAYGNLRFFRGESAVLTWLTKIAVRCCLDMLRRRPDTTSIDDEYDLSGGDTAEGTVERKQQIAAVRRAVAKLPEEMRTVLVLRDMEGYSYEEIASVLEISEGTLKSRIFRAREKLRKILLENGELF